MKANTAAAILAVMATSVCPAAYGQGTVTFANSWFGYSAPDYLNDGLTKISGPEFVAQLMAGPTANNLTPVASTPFLTGSRAGYFYGGSLTIPSIACGALGYFQLNVWNTNTGATFAEAQASALPNAWAQSIVFPALTSGGRCCEPPCVPTTLVGIPSLILNGPTASPSLTLTRSETNTLLLEWLSPPGAYGVQQKPDLYSSNSTMLVNTSSNFGASNQTVLLASADHSFYRLVSEQTQFACTTSGGALRIANYLGPGGEVIIPDTINGWPVQSIGQYAFYKSVGLVSVVIPDSVTSIAESAFESCSNLTQVVLGKGLASIGANAFGGCASLTSITIPDNVSSIGDRAFNLCLNLSTVSLGNGISSIGYATFAGSGLTSVRIPDNVTNIADFAFEGTRLRSITIPNNVKMIGADSFQSTGLTNVLFGAGLRFIGVGAFYDCSNLVEVTIPKGVLDIGAAAFEQCPNLVRLTMEEGVTNLGDYAWARCTALTNVVIPNSVGTIASYCFVGCTNLVSLTIGTGVTHIGWAAFENCINLKGAYFKGDAPDADSSVFIGDNDAIVYYLPGTSGWGATFGGRPTALWTSLYPLVLSRGPSIKVITNQIFQFAPVSR